MTFLLKVSCALAAIDTKVKFPNSFQSHVIYIYIYVCACARARVTE